ncbi:flagellar biosynthesis anti-sigma factor FlgM [Clostridium sp. CF012]|uniref:flagellar biosynthesis anti-sigma factor FlgM n=1 Tax=Clostridium sp. CF012 TaxID=2843319 RepID=UPI001C0D509D|nr:flagellar biosynthesis anti-sigma factor FlgM [Clostridium sp. CF012]MBU3142352.1 flagellar biosynthesis anti-sigma factor FlgM [Clostridium sp. CF012]
MKIDGVKNNVVSFYKNNTSKMEAKTPVSKKDTVELSSVGKTLSSLSLEGKSLNSKDTIEVIRNEVMQGTYKMDSTSTAKKMIDIIKGRDI